MKNKGGNNMNIIDEIKNELRRYNLTTEQISERLNINLNDIFNGKKKLEMDELLRIIDFLNPSFTRATELVNMYKEEYSKKC